MPVHIHKAISAFPWDLQDEGTDAVLDRLQGEVGLNTLAVWSACPACCVLRARPIEPRIVRNAGGHCFQATPSAYAATRCKPTASARPRGRDPLAIAAEACGRRGLALRAIVSASRTGQMASRYTEMACRNALGDRSDTSLCLGNPDVQVYVQHLVADLTARESVAGVIVTDFDIAYVPPAHARFARRSCGIDWLLSLCFCESCLQSAEKADLDSEAARSSVRRLLDRQLSGRPEADRPPLAAQVADDEVLLRYIQRRNAVLAELWHGASKSCQGELILDFARVPQPTDHPAHAGGLAGNGGDGLPRVDPLSWPAAARPAIVLTPVGCESDLETCAGAWRREVRFTAERSEGHAGPEWVRLVAASCERGIGGVQFDHYGILSDAALTAIRQAFRFASRATSAS